MSTGSRNASRHRLAFPCAGRKRSAANSTHRRITLTPAAADSGARGPQIFFTICTSPLNISREQASSMVYSRIARRPWSILQRHRQQVRGERRAALLAGSLTGSLHPAQLMQAREGFCRIPLGWRSPCLIGRAAQTQPPPQLKDWGARARGHFRLQARPLPSMAQAGGARVGAPARYPRPAAHAPGPPSAGGA